MKERKSFSASILTCVLATKYSKQKYGDSLYNYNFMQIFFTDQLIKNINLWELGPICWL